MTLTARLDCGYPLKLGMLLNITHIQSQWLRISRIFSTIFLFKGFGQTIPHIHSPKKPISQNVKTRVSAVSFSLNQSHEHQLANDPKKFQVRATNPDEIIRSSQTIQRALYRGTSKNGIEKPLNNSSLWIKSSS